MKPFTMMLSTETHCATVCNITDSVPVFEGCWLSYNTTKLMCLSGIECISHSLHVLAVYNGVGSVYMCIYIYIYIYTL
jgi:hypothetical protein